ncbi:MAG: DNA-directed RNA polymerase subunit omega [Oscillospiraceae bacterium]|nr:DNA-directed RNA polymerase subunit omega [Oscillospiraceae bacterium]
MLKPSLSQILKKNESYYSLVVAVAKRAREIAEESEKNKVILVEKPVQLAVEDFAFGRYHLVESKELKEDRK